MLTPIKSPGFNVSGSTRPMRGKNIVYMRSWLDPACISVLLKATLYLASGSLDDSTLSLSSWIQINVCPILLLFIFWVNIKQLQQSSNKSSLVIVKPVISQITQTSTTFPTRYGSCLFILIFSLFSLIFSFIESCSCFKRVCSDRMTCTMELIEVVKMGGSWGRWWIKVFVEHGPARHGAKQYGTNNNSARTESSHQFLVQVLHHTRSASTMCESGCWAAHLDIIFHESCSVCDFFIREAVNFSFQIVVLLIFP